VHLGWVDAVLGSIMWPGQIAIEYYSSLLYVMARTRWDEGANRFSLMEDLLVGSFCQS
jgi:hypothetical protein